MKLVYYGASGRGEIWGLSQGRPSTKASKQAIRKATSNQSISKYDANHAIGQRKCINVIYKIKGII